MRIAAIYLLLCFVGGSLPAQEASAGGASSADAEQVVEGVMKELRRGLEGHSQHRAQSVFDADRFPGYLAFQDRLGQFFAAYDPIRVHYRVLQAQSSADDLSAMVEVQLEADPAEGRSGMPMRRDQEMQVTLHHTGKSWKVTDLKPREMFTP